MKRKVTTTIKPDEEIEVGDAEFTDLSRQDLILSSVPPPTPVPPGGDQPITAPAPRTATRPRAEKKPVPDDAGATTKEEG